LINKNITQFLRSELIGLNTIGVQNIILDLSNLKFVDSSGLSAILIGDRLCKQNNGNLVLSNANEYVMKLLRISQLDNILTVLPSVQEAKDFIMMEELEREINQKEVKEDIGKE